jgi:hypothetical protein
MPVPQSFNKIKLTTSNNSEYDIMLQEISGQLYINNHLVITSANIGSLSNITTIESDVTTLQTDVTTLQSDVQELQPTFNISTRDTEANILASTPTNPSGEVTVAYGTDTGDFYIYDGSAWYVYKDDTFTNTYSLSFDGSDDYIDLGTSSTLNPTSALTISAWVYINGAGTGSLPTIYSSSKNSAGTSGGIALAYTSNKIRFYLDKTGSSSWVFAESNSIMNTSQWYHLAGTWNGSTVTLYVNGTAQTTTGSATTIGYNTDFPATIGRYSSNYFEGLIDEVSFFDYALDQTQINNLRGGVASGTLGSPSDIDSYSLGPVSWWRMGEMDGSTGSTITDQGSESNNGTLTNGPTFSTTVPS